MKITKAESELMKKIGRRGGLNRMKLLDAEGRRKLAQKAGLQAGLNRKAKKALLSQVKTA